MFKYTVYHTFRNFSCTYNNLAVQETPVLTEFENLDIKINKYHFS